MESEKCKIKRLTYPALSHARRGLRRPFKRSAGWQNERDALRQYLKIERRFQNRFAVEIHYASVKHSRVRRLLRRALDQNIGRIRDGIVRAQRAGALESADSELLACAVMVFVMGLMHMETLLPHLVGDLKWHDFVEKRMDALLGTRN